MRRDKNLRFSVCSVRDQERFGIGPIENSDSGF
jgi:hypothetical protein